MPEKKQQWWCNRCNKLHLGEIPKSLQLHGCCIEDLAASSQLVHAPHGWRFTGDIMGVSLLPWSSQIWVNLRVLFLSEPERLGQIIFQRPSLDVVASFWFFARSLSFHFSLTTNSRFKTHHDTSDCSFHYSYLQPCKKRCLHMRFHETGAVLLHRT